MKRFLDKIVVVTGSSRGFGATIARAFAREGATVVITYHREAEGEEERARAVAAETRSELVLPLEVRERSSVREVFGAAAARYGRIDILVNNAGINRVGDFDQISEEDWDAVLDTDLKGVFLCSQEVLPHMGAGGRVVNIGSVSGQYGGPRTPSYAAAKAGVMALTHCLARFVGERGITVNCVAPGAIASEMLDSTMPASVRDKVFPNILLGRQGTPEEVAEAVLFCAAAGSSYMTGQTIAVNGGLWV
ncbi:MAG: 3-oxoacyl-ACP reductase family protein [Planctomycetota bacterium]